MEYPTDTQIIPLPNPDTRQRRPRVEAPAPEIGIAE
jgi:hypothetical protein